MQLPGSVSRDLSSYDVSGDEIGRIPDVLDSFQDILKSHSLILLAPTKRSRQTFVLCKRQRSAPKAKSTSPIELSCSNAQHTEKVLHQRPIRRSSFRVSKRNDRRRQLTETELLHRRSESVSRVESAGVDLAREFAVGELFGGKDAGGPKLFGGGKGGRVEEVVVTVVGIHAAGVAAGLVGLSDGWWLRFASYLRLASCSRTLWRFN
jgi:hypothetical protein